MSSTDPMTPSASKTRSELRRFGLAFGGGLTVLGSLLLWRGRPAGPYVLGGAAIILLLAAVLPRGLAPLEWFMARLFRVVTGALTYVILTIVFFLVLTPLGLFRRLMGKDGLGLRPDPSKTTYWVDVDPEGPCSRPGKPF
jgi:hypothetical protein